MTQEAETARALAVLFVSHFDPATQDKPRLRQCLSVFFPAYAAASSSHQHHIARAFRRAARGALGVAPVKKALAPQLMRYMLQVGKFDQLVDYIFLVVGPMGGVTRKPLPTSYGYIWKLTPTKNRGQHQGAQLFIRTSKAQTARRETSYLEHQPALIPAGLHHRPSLCSLYSNLS